MLDKFLFRSHLEEGESIKYIVHTHYIRLFKSMLANFLLGFLVPILGFIIMPAALFLWLAIFLFIFLKTLYNYLDWYFDTWLVTNFGVIDIEWKGIFNRSSSRVEYNSVEGVSIEVPGFWATVLSFGNLSLETMSRTPMNLEMAMRPSRVESEILKYRERYLHERNLADEGVLRDILSSMVSRHIKDYGLGEKR